MSTTDLRTDVPFSRAEHTPWWAVAFAALLLAVSFGQRRAGEETARAGKRAALEAGRGRSTDTPSEIPARGWKDILLRVDQTGDEGALLFRSRDKMRIGHPHIVGCRLCALNAAVVALAT
jgi:hypothetical protein